MLALCAACAAPAGAQPAGTRLLLDRAVDYTSLSLEELSQIEVTSVSGRVERLSEAAASVFVITAEDIRRSSATTLAEALRLAPNLQLARVDAGLYAITARGFNTNIANKLLVLVDGRTLYSPLFSGVAWEARDVLLDDVDRIEVISGPGGTIWGTNAVNGVINVITRSARDTQGALASVSAGSRTRAAAARYGLALQPGAHLRAYAKRTTDDDVVNPLPGAATRFARSQAGFRLDLESGRHAFTLQGDAYDGDSNERALPGAGAVTVSGGNILGRWSRYTGDGELGLQAYVDRTERRDNYLLQEHTTLFDLDVRRVQQVGEYRFVYGAGYRRGDSESDPGIVYAFIPAERQLTWSNVFAQGQVPLRGVLDLTLGARLERNPYTGTEFLPSARLGWRLGGGRLAWAALSRAVRAPARLDRDLHSPPTPPFLLAGGPAFRSEVATVAELGYRATRGAYSYSLTGFNHRYEHLRSLTFGPGGALPVTIVNDVEGDVYGLEGWARWQLNAGWRLTAGATALKKDLRLRPGSTSIPASPGNLGNDPDYQLSLRSAWNLSERQQFDVALRRVGALPQPPVPAYTAVDLRYGWQARRDLEIELVGRNILDPRHAEWADPTPTVEVGRSVFLRITWRL